MGETQAGMAAEAGERKPWDQMEGEPDRWYGRFQIYLELGVTRTLKAAAAAAGRQARGAPLEYSGRLVRSAHAAGTGANVRTPGMCTSVSCWPSASATRAWPCTAAASSAWKTTWTPSARCSTRPT